MENRSKVNSGRRPFLEFGKLELVPNNWPPSCECEHAGFERRPKITGRRAASWWISLPSRRSDALSEKKKFLLLLRTRYYLK